VELIIRIANTVIIAGALAVAITQLYLLRKQLKDQHEWNRRSAALHYSFSEHPETRVIRARLEKKLNLYQRKPGEISLTEIKTMEQQDSEIRGELQYILGRLASMCAAMNDNIISEKVCKDLMRGTVIRYFRFFRQYIEDIRKERNNPNLYRCLELFAVRWENDDIKLPNGLPPTG
jgi:hypothetical protein